jgi:hypothetical protein
MALSVRPALVAVVADAAVMATNPVAGLPTTPTGAPPPSTAAHTQPPPGQGGHQGQPVPPHPRRYPVPAGQP